MQDFGKKLIAARKLRHMTQEQLGQALNVSRRFSGATLTLSCTDSLGNAHTVSAYVTFTYPPE